MNCPCDSDYTFESCCEPYLNGTDRPDTAEELMRSRYTAFTLQKMDYIYETHDPKTRGQLDLDASKKWAETAEWDGLDILEVIDGDESDDEGFVEFKAFYSEDGEAYEHHELGEFVRRHGKWYFHDGKDMDQTTFVREEPKVGRNDPCVCGSGKKYKKCCGAA